jgi:hypothetical protein
LYKLIISVARRLSKGATQQDDATVTNSIGENAKKSDVKGDGTTVVSDQLSMMSEISRPRAVLQFTCSSKPSERWLFLEEKATQRRASRV